uniref:Uncharacterized protein n=1 Tax=Cacopsylla melanoneura TaxID=428564 RepID=A0A8D9EIK7_9HEMI
MASLQSPVIVLLLTAYTRHVRSVSISFLFSSQSSSLGLDSTLFSIPVKLFRIACKQYWAQDTCGSLLELSTSMNQGIPRSCNNSLVMAELRFTSSPTMRTQPKYISSLVSHLSSPLIFFATPDFINTLAPLGSLANTTRLLTAVTLLSVGVCGSNTYLNILLTLF